MHTCIYQHVTFSSNWPLSLFGQISIEVEWYIRSVHVNNCLVLSERCRVPTTCTSIHLVFSLSLIASFLAYILPCLLLHDRIYVNAILHLVSQFNKGFGRCSSASNPNKSFIRNETMITVAWLTLTLNLTPICDLSDHSKRMQSQCQLMRSFTGSKHVLVTRFTLNLTMKS